MEIPNEYLFIHLQYGQIQEHRAALEYNQQASIEAKPAEAHQQALEQFTFFGDQPLGSMLQLAPIPPNLYPYHHQLQLAQPGNLQE